MTWLKRWLCKIPIVNWFIPSCSSNGNWNGSEIRMDYQIPTTSSFDWNGYDRSEMCLTTPKHLFKEGFPAYGYSYIESIAITPTYIVSKFSTYKVIFEFYDSSDTLVSSDRIIANTHSDFWEYSIRGNSSSTKGVYAKICLYGAPPFYTNSEYPLELLYMRGPQLVIVGSSQEQISQIV